MAQYLKLLGGIQGALAVLTALLSFTAHTMKQPAEGGAVVAFTSVVLLLAARWLVRRSPSNLDIALLDVVATAGVLVAMVVASIRATDTISADFSVLFLATTLLLRVAVVPAAPLATLGVGLVAALTAVAAAAVAHGRGATLQMDTAEAIGNVAFTCIMLGITARVSSVIHGLNLRVESAMRLGQYTLVEKLGEGGMGTVWRAEHAMLRRPTAVKLLRSASPSATTLARFEREVQLTAEISHPNIVAVFDFGRSDDGTLYYAMEFVDGVSFDDLIRQHGRQPPERVIHFLRQVSAALAAAHARGMIHRDIKPANVLVSRGSEPPDLVKVVDFGLVKATARRGYDSPPERASRADEIVGTPTYMAPESITAPDSVDQSADVYALGGVAYYLLTGAPPFEGASLVDVCRQQLYEAPIPPCAHAPDIPAELEDLVLQCLAKSKAVRPSASELVMRLDALARDYPWSRDQAQSCWL